MAVKPLSYAKNVAKSLGYISIKSISGINEDLTDYTRNTADNLKSMYESVKEFKSALSGTSIKDNDFVNLAGTFVRNSISDLKTGKFYNPDRANETNSKFFEDYTDGLMDFDFDDDDWDNFDNDLENDDVTKSDVKQASDKVAAATVRSSMGSSSRIIQGANLNTKALIRSNTKMFGKLNTSVAALTGTVLTLVEPLNAHIKNSTTFFEFSTNEMSKQTELLTGIYTILSNRFGQDGKGRPQESKSSYRKSSWERVTEYGMPDLGEFFKHAKGSAIDNLPGGSYLAMARDLLTPDTIQMIMSGEGINSPIATLLSLALSSGIRKTSFGRAIGRLPGKINNAFAYKTAKWNQTAKTTGGLKGIIASILDVSPRVDNVKRFDQYNKGPVDWTGIDSRALTYVIPLQLSAILSSITGQEPKIYNYKTGKWETSRSALIEFKNEQKSEIYSATYNFRNKINFRYRAKHSLEKGSALESDFDAEVGRLMMILANNNINPKDILDNPNEMKKEFIKKGLMVRKGAVAKGDQLHEESYDQLISILSTKSNKDLTREFIGASYDARVANNQFIARFNESNAPNAALARFDRSGIAGQASAKAHAKPVRTIDGFVGTNILNTRDTFGNNIFFYLQEYYKQLGALTRGKDLSMVPKNTRFRGIPNTNNRVRYDNRTDRSRSRSLARSVQQPIRVPDNSARYIDNDDYMLSVTGEYHAYHDPTDPRNENARRKTTSRADRERLESLSEVERERRKRDLEQELREEERENQQSGWDRTIDTLLMIFTGETSIDSARSALKRQGGITGILSTMPQRFDNFKHDIRTKARNKFNEFKDSEFGQRFFGDAGGSIINYLGDVLGGLYHGTKRTTKWIYNGYKSGEFDTRSADAGIFTDRVTGTGSGLFYNFTGGASKRPIPKKVRNTWAKPEGVTQAEYQDILEKSKDPAKYAWYDDKTDTIVITTRDKETGKSHNWVSNSRKIKALVKPDSFESKSRNNIKKAGARLAGSELSQDSVYIRNKVKEKIDYLLGTETAQKGKDIGKEVKKFLPETLSGGTFGALAGGVLTGSGLGLLGGFVVGAGVSLVKNSEVANQKLFGTADPLTGEYGGGLMPAKLANFFKKRFPKMKKSMTVGSILGGVGILPGGLLGGLVLGSGFEFVRGSKAFNDALFGPEGVDGKRRGGLVGALKDNIIDPLVEFGKNHIGKGGEKIKDYFKKIITDPLMKFFNPLKTWSKGFTRKLIRGARRKFSNISANVGSTVSNILQRSKLFGAGKALGKFGVWAGSKILGVPGAIVGAAGDALDLHNIRAGYDDRDAAERYEALVNNHRLGRDLDLMEYNRILAGQADYVKDFGSVEDLQNLAFVLGGKNAAKEQYGADRTRVTDMILGSINHGGDTQQVKINGKIPGLKKKVNLSTAIRKAMSNGDFDAVQAYINNLGEDDITEERKAALNSYFQEQRSRLELSKQMMLNPETLSQEARAALNAKGITDAMLADFAKSNAVRTQIDTDLLKMGRDSEKDVSVLNQKALSQAELNRVIDETASPVEREQLNVIRKISDILQSVAEKLGVKSKSGDNTQPSSGVESNGSNGPVPLQEISGGETTDLAGNIIDTARQKLETRSDAEEAAPAVSDVLNTSAVVGGASNVNDASKEKNRRETVVTAEGTTIQLTENASGERIPDMNDSQTKQHFALKATRDRFYAMMTDTKNGFFDRIGRLFGFSLDDKTNSKENSNSIFGRLLGRVGNLLGGLTGGLGSLLARIIPGASTIASAISAALPAALAAAGVGYTLSKASEKYAGTDYDPNNRKDLANEDVKARTEALTGFDKIGNGLDSLLNKASGKNMNTYKSSDFVSETASSRIAKAFKRSIVTAPFMGKATAAVARRVPYVGKFLSAGFNKLSNLGNAEKLGGAAVKAAQIIKDKITPILTKVVTMFGGEADSVAVAAENITEGLVTSGGPKLVAETLKTVGIVLYAAGIIWAVIEGAQEGKAMTILGIIDPPTIGQRIIAAVLNGLNAAIPFIGGIIPTEKIFNIVYAGLKLIPGLSKWLKSTDLEAQRQKAKNTLAKFNEENGTTYNMEEYITNHLGKLTLGQKFKKFIGNKRNSDYISFVKGNSNVEENAAYYMGATGSGLPAFTGGASAVDVTSAEATNVVSAVTDRIGATKEINLKAFINRLWQFASSSKSMTEFDAAVKEAAHQAGSMGDGEFNSSTMQIQLSATLMRYVVSFMRPFMYIAENFNKVNLKESTTEKSSDTSKDGFLTNVKNAVSGFIGKSKNFLSNIFAGSGSGNNITHVTQSGHEKFGNSTLEENGCGPAVAATVLRQYGKHAGIRDAARYAIANGYVAGASGTRAGYFGDIFGRNGIRTSYTTSSGGINSAINSGRPTVLLGQDGSNTSKANSPFGPNPHYVVARGTSGGNVMIDDPELSRPALYPRSILKGTKLGIMTGGKSSISSSGSGRSIPSSGSATSAKTSSSGATVSNPAGNYEEAIWGYFKGLGLSDEAAAGVLANIKHEAGSDFNPSRVERLFAYHLMGLDGDGKPSEKWKNYGNIYANAGVDVSSATKIDETYTAALDAGKISQDEFMHPYKMVGLESTSGDHKWLQYGYGLTQFTSPGLKESLYKNTIGKGKSIADLGGQLTALTEQFQANNNVWPVLTKAGVTPGEAASAILLHYEKPNDKEAQVGKRSKSAEELFSKYSGKNFDSSKFSADPTSSGATTPPTFPVYNLSESQLKGVANILQHEQASAVGRHAEASLMANLIDISGDDKVTAGNLEKFLMKEPGENWFAQGKERYLAGKEGRETISDSALQAAIHIFNEGKRTIPRYINEHDSFSDIAEFNGRTTGLTKEMANRAHAVPDWVKDRSAYKAGDNITNVYGSQWKFSMFPDSTSDPFGYTSDTYKSKWGEAHFNVDESGNISGSTGAIAAGVSSSSGTSSSTSSNTSSENGESSWDIGSILNNVFVKTLSKLGAKMGGAVGGIISAILGGEDSSSSQQSSGHGGGPSTTYQSIDGGVHGGSGRKFDTTVTPGTTVPAGEEFTPVSTAGFSEKETKIVDVMNSILGKNSYSMTGTRDPFSGSADCSSTVNGVINRAIGVSPGGDTGSILNSSVGTIVDQYSTGDPTAKNSGGPHLTNLRPGDLMLYSRPDSGYSSGRKYRVGHVEMYMGNGLRAGHGSGTGPKITDATTDSSRYILSKRYTGEGSGLKAYDFTSGDVIQVNRATGGASAVNNRIATVALNDKEELLQKLNDMIELIKVLTANSAYASVIPQIVVAIQQLGGITAQIAGGDSNMSADTKAKIEEDISSMMARVNALATAT